MDWHVLQRYQETTFCLEIFNHSLHQAVGTVEYSAARHTANVAYARDPDALCCPVNGHQRHLCSFAESSESAEDLHFGKCHDEGRRTTSKVKKLRVYFVVDGRSKWLGSR